MIASAAGLDIHARSGSVALPRVKVVLARAALLVADGAAERTAVRRALWRKSVVAMASCDRRSRCGKEVERRGVVQLLIDNRRTEMESRPELQFD